jgi:hypothetical protein
MYRTIAPPPSPKQAEVGFSITANHGGGYAFRLCKSTGNTKELTEECFQAGHLAFSDSMCGLLLFLSLFPTQNIGLLLFLSMLLRSCLFFSCEKVEGKIVAWWA